MAEKKSETLEVRVSYSQKQAFMTACAEAGTTASDQVRHFIDQALSGGSSEAEPRLWRQLLVTLKSHPLKTAASVAASAALLSIVATSPSLAEDHAFSRFDRNSDGIISLDEFRIGDQGRGATELFTILDTDKSLTLNRDEFKSSGTVTRRSDERTARGDDEVRILSVEMATFDIAHEGRSSISIINETAEVDVNASSRTIDRAFADLEAQVTSMAGTVPAPPEAPRAP